MKPYPHQSKIADEAFAILKKNGNFKPLSLSLSKVSEPIDRSPLNPTHYYQICTKCKDKLKRRKDRLEEIPVCKSCKLTKHGLCSKSGKAPGYRRWERMMFKCNNKKSEHYKLYGARGIKVCKEWEDPTVFNQWCIDNTPSRYLDSEGLDIHRKDNDGNYEPSNCVLITRSEHSTIHNRQRKLK